MLQASSIRGSDFRRRLGFWHRVWVTISMQAAKIVDIFHGVLIIQFVCVIRMIFDIEIDLSRTAGMQANMVVAAKLSGRRPITQKKSFFIKRKYARS